MCFNQYVSINTFLFSIFILLLIAWNNKYSPYKTKDFNSIYVYLFFLSFIFMQLIEFFLWRNINDPVLNKLFSLIGATLILFQPIFSLFMLKNESLKKIMILLYSIPATIYFIYEYNKKEFTTSVSQNGHLKWNWISMIGNNEILLFAWLFFLFFSLFMNQNYSGILFAFGLFIFSFYSKYIRKDKSSGSLWCWSVNVFLLFYAIQLLLIFPYLQHGFC
jgi:hypothetical protein